MDHGNDLLVDNAMPAFVNLIALINMSNVNRKWFSILTTSRRFRSAGTIIEHRKYTVTKYSQRSYINIRLIETKIYYGPKYYRTTVKQHQSIVYSFTIDATVIFFNVIFFNVIFFDVNLL